MLLRPLAALPLLVALVLLRLAILLTLPVAWGCRVVANDLPSPLERAYRANLRFVNRVRAWLWLTTDDPEQVALSLRQRPPHRRARAWTWVVAGPVHALPALLRRRCWWRCSCRWAGSPRW